MRRQRNCNLYKKKTIFIYDFMRQLSHPMNNFNTNWVHQFHRYEFTVWNIWGIYLLCAHTITRTDKTFSIGIYYYICDSYDFVCCAQQYTPAIVRLCSTRSTKCEIRAILTSATPYLTVSAKYINDITKYELDHVCVSFRLMRSIVQSVSILRFVRNS